MQPLFGSETDGIQERKLVKRLLRKKKITFILTALCAVIYLLQNIGFEEPIYGFIPLSGLFLGRSGSMALFHSCYCSFVGTAYFI